MGLVPAKVVGRDAGHTLGALHLGGQVHLVGHRKHGGHGVDRHHVVAQGYAARNLYIDKLVGLAGRCLHHGGVVGNQALHHRCPVGLAQGVGQTQLGEAAVQSRHVLGKAKRLAGVYRYDFVHAVAKNKATVHDADLGVGEFGVLTVEVTRQGGECAHVSIIAARQNWAMGFYV